MNITRKCRNQSDSRIIPKELRKSVSNHNKVASVVLRAYGDVTIQISRRVYYSPYWFKICRSNKNSNASQQLILCLFVCFVALHPKSTAMVIAGRSVHLTTLIPGQA